MTLHHFSFPTAITFGGGARFETAAALARNHLGRVLIITDRGVAVLPLFGEYVTACRAGGVVVAVYDGVAGNPTSLHVEQGVAAYRETAAQAIIGIGGGAALDVAKAVALMVDHPGGIFDYEDGRADARLVTGTIPYLILLPTTAGTGSEVGRSAVISDPDTHVKRIIFSPRLLAREVFADPELTLALPPGITAATGMDALTHCVEAFLARDWHPICDGVALEGLHLAAGSLLRCYRDGADGEARSQMLMASMMGAISFQKGLGVTHSCAHALSALANMHHGLANAVMIDHALVHNLAAVPERFQRLAQAAGVAGGGPAFLAWLTTLKAGLGIPATLAAAGIDRGLEERLVAAALADSCHQSNPVPCGPADLRVIFRRAFGER